MAKHGLTVMAAVLVSVGIAACAQEGSVDAEGTVIGESVQGRPIRAYAVGDGSDSLLIVGGIHGGYEWNSIVLARRLLDHFRENLDSLPSGYTLYVIPNMNPDGLYRVTGGEPISEVDMSERNTVPGRFNANGVDLNRNWASEDWEPTSSWGTREVDAGSEPFSEPETQAVRDFLLQHRPQLVVFYQSAANGIWYSGKPDQWDPAQSFAEAYAEASGYPLPPPGEGPVDYEITGAASQYLYSLGIPTLTIELASHAEVAVDRNVAGLQAVFSLLSPEAD